MHPKQFLEITEAKLLTALGEKLHEFFEDFSTIYSSWNEVQAEAGPLKTLYQNINGAFQPMPENLQALLYFQRQEVNPSAAVQPLAQCNMVANATFHLMAQQIAIVLHGMPELKRETVLNTTTENIGKLVEVYLKEIQEKEGTDAEADGEGPPSSGK